MPSIAQIRADYTYQSYFDTTLLEKALLAQIPGSGIVTSTRSTCTIRGYKIVLSPESRTPVAFEIQESSIEGLTSPVILFPGQSITLGQDRPFSSFAYGLPFGWLGGGLATILVFRNNHSDMTIGTQREVIFHRATYKIVADATPLPAIVTNWPIAFPWKNALRGSGSQNQGGLAQIGVTPTRIIMRLRVANLTTAVSMRMTWRGTQDFDQDSAGVDQTTNATYTDVTWPEISATAPAWPMLEFNGPEIRLGGPDCGLTLTDNANATLTNKYVDVVRYGTLG